MIEADRLISAGTTLPEDVADRAICPKLLEEYVGQPQVVRRWRFSSKQRNCAAMPSIIC